jgi:hypothetical protein
MRTQKWSQQLGSFEKLSYNVLELEMVYQSNFCGNFIE